MKLQSYSEKDTYEIGRSLGEKTAEGSVVSLTGDLGVGKTVFTAGFAKGLGITEPICSPTFTIVQVYEEGRIPLYHFDVYRIDDPDEMYEIGFDEYAYGNGVCLIEWGEKIEEILPENTIHISIKKDLDQGFDFREIDLEGFDGE